MDILLNCRIAEKTGRLQEFVEQPVYPGICSGEIIKAEWSGNGIAVHFGWSCLRAEHHGSPRHAWTRTIGLRDESCVARVRFLGKNPRPRKELLRALQFPNSLDNQCGGGPGLADLNRCAE